MKIAILGTGAYGIALALMFRENKSSIMMWTKFEDEKEMLENERCHKKALPTIHLPSEIQFTENMEEAVQDSTIIVIAVPAAFVSSVCSELKNYILSSQHILIASKGIERSSLLFMDQIVCKHIIGDHIAVLSGPTFALDLASYVPSALTLASTSTESLITVRKALENKYIRIDTSMDVQGVSLCGAIKNVFAIAFGIVDGMGYPISTKALFFTEVVRDMQGILKDIGASAETILSFAGLGDLYLTCSSEKSRNFVLGQMIGRGSRKKEIDTYIETTTVEGLYTLVGLQKWFQQKKIYIPIIDVIDDIIYQRKEKEELLTFLLHKE